VHRLEARLVQKAPVVQMRMAGFGIRSTGEEDENGRGK